ncbi:MAG: hypothetical protein K2X50_09840 [Gammaproteobacteria bacterium]|nr:hypothetical protein [Gammaproteobacteria bacterium]
MNEKTKSELKAFISPTKFLLLKGTPPTVDERVDYLRNNTTIPLDDPIRKEIMEEGLKEHEKGELIRKIDLLSKERIVQDFLRSSPTVDERINFVIANSLIGEKLGEQTFHLMREGLNESDQNEFISKLVMREWERVKNSKGEYFIRGSSIYSTAVKFAVNQEYKNDPISAAKYSQNTSECVRDFRVPSALVGVAKEIANSGDLANLIFPMISGVITDNYNRQWEEAKKSTDPTITETAEKMYKSVANASQKLKKLNNASKKPPSDSDADDLKEYRKAVEALTSKVIEAKINEPSNTQPKTAPPTTPRSAPTTPRSDDDAQSPRKDRTKRGAMKLSAEKLETAGIKTSPRTETSHETLAEPPVEPAARAATTRPRSPKERPPLPDFSPAPASSPDSPREKVTTGTQRTTSDSEKTPPPSPRDIKIATHRPPPPDYSAPSPSASPRGQPMIGMQRKQSTENLAAKSGTTSDPENTATSRPRRGAIIDRQSDNSKEASPSSPRKEPASDNIQLASSSDIVRLRKQVAEVKAKAKALETRVAETRQDYKNVKDQRLEVNKLDTEIGGLEAKKEAAKILREEHQAKIAQHREKTSTQQLTGSHPQEKDSLPPQVKDMMTKSKVQQEKAEKIADAADAAKTNPRHSTPSRGSERR